MLKQIQGTTGSEVNTVTAGEADKNDADVTSSLLQESQLPRKRISVGKPHKKKKKDGSLGHTENKSGILGLFRYASCSDLVLISIGFLFSTISGASFPILALVFGQMTNTFIEQAKQDTLYTTNNSVAQNTTGTSTDFLLPQTTTSPVQNASMFTGSRGPLSPEEFNAYMTRFALYYVYIGISVLIASFFQTLCWEMACERQVHKLRQIFFSQILRQDVTWYDQHQDGDLTIKLSDDLERIREGIGSKVSMVSQYLATFISGLLVGLYANWRLTLIILALGPFLILTSAYMARVASSSAAREQLKYSLAGKVAEEVLHNVRTVSAFGGQTREISRYEIALEEGRCMAMRKYYILAIGLAAVFFVMYASYGVAFWYGSHLIEIGVSTPGSVFTVFFSVMTGAFSVGNALPYINALSTAVGAASTIFGIIDRIPNIDPYSNTGARPARIDGNIRFKDVHFTYPTRLNVPVLQGLNLDIKAGKTVAIVGSSGAGKSTIVSLLLRFYNVEKGQVLLDGRPVESLNLGWLRSQIGVVSQEPILFGVSIAENISYGRLDVSQEEIVDAAKQANAHTFVKDLPEGYNTLVGERGAQLSGGQKQRIAIARALIRDPKILLLDEATSALDSESEGVVQEALDKAMQNRTTIIIAHRLSTVRNAQVIYALKDGVAKESGTHDELMAKKGLYHSLVTAQVMSQEEIKTSVENGPKKETSRKQFHRALSISTHSLQNAILNEEDESEEIEPTQVNVWELIKFSSPEWRWLVLGLFGCCLTGAVMPVFAFFYGEIFATFTKSGEELRSAAIFWTWMFFGLACVSAFAFWMQVVAMTTSAEKLVMRLRLKGFTSLLQQGIGWFDLESNSPNRLITRLAREAPLVKAAAGLRVGQVLGSVVTLVSGLLIAFIFGWKLAVVLVLAVPIIIIANHQQMSLLRANQKRDTQLMDDAGRVASESVQNVKTVQALGRERLFLQLYMEYLFVPFREAKKQAFVYSAVFAISQAVIYLMYAGAFRYGAYLIEIGEMSSTEVYRVFFALAFCAASVGQTTAYLQDYTKAKSAAGQMFRMINLRSEIDPTSQMGAKPDIHGKVTFDSVEFSYPNRSEVQVLRGLTVSVEPGKTLALVGTSGCGKSTLIALLMRFYDPNGGRVLVDDIDIRTLNLTHLRSAMGLVTQEPILFDCTIRENIAYGARPTENGVQISDIIQAAITANIHEFVVSLPQGYETQVGEGGTQLSGGQKQRIAIARALVRDPRILLLDEATSALDTESEKVVQAALEKAREGRTSIVIAHRLSTVQSADQIAVIHRGRVVETGTHNELSNQFGRYYELVQRQRL